MLCVASLVFFDRVALATAVLFAFALVSALVSTMLSFRAKSLRRVIGLGCGTLLVGVILGLAVMLIMISRIAGNPG